MALYDVYDEVGDFPLKNKTNQESWVSLLVETLRTQVMS